MESLVCMTNAFTALRRILILTGSTVGTHIGCNWKVYKRECILANVEAFTPPVGCQNYKCELKLNCMHA